MLTQLLTELLRAGVEGSEALQAVLGSSALAHDTIVYGLLLVLFIIYMPCGIPGTLIDRWNRIGTASLEYRPPCAPRHDVA